MFKRKKKSRLSINPSGEATMDLGIKKSPRPHPVFTDYDKRRIQNQDRSISDLQAQIRLLAGHLDLVIMKHDRFGTYALVSKEALKNQPIHMGEPQTETEE